MSDSWDLAIQGESLQFLLAVRRREREMAFTYLRQLALNPYQDFDFTETSPNKREYRVKIVGNYAFSYWLDHFVKEVRVVKIVRCRAR